MFHAITFHPDIPETRCKWSTTVTPWRKSSGYGKCWGSSKMCILATFTKEVIFADLSALINLESFSTGLILSKSKVNTFYQTGDKRFHRIELLLEQYQNFARKLDTWGKT